MAYLQDQRSLTSGAFLELKGLGCVAAGMLGRFALFLGRNFQARAGCAACCGLQETQESRFWR